MNDNNTEGKLMNQHLSTWSDNSDPTPYKVGLRRSMNDNNAEEKLMNQHLRTWSDNSD